jgi:hypothetical protein
MFLRWHYLIDVCAGLTLAGSAALFAARFSTWETGLRAARRLPPVWIEPLYLGRFAFPAGRRSGDRASVAPRLSASGNPPDER